MRERLIEEYLNGMGTDSWKVFGAHFSHEYDQDGVRFTVYAPNARNVSLIGSFNNWQGYDMFREPSGIWSIFARDIPENSLYKYRITTQTGDVYDRSDPFAFFSEQRPNTASIVYNMEGHFHWSDNEWMSHREKNICGPMNIYEVHAGSWKKDGEKFLRYGELAEELIPYLKEMGYTHVELLPLTEHPLDASWGYQPSGYFSATSRYGTPEELMSLIDRCHRENIGVILDFVPVHFVSDFYALHQYDGGAVYESQEESQRYTEWGSVRFDYTKPHVISFVRSALDFWLHHYHLDGIRYDAVSNLIYPNGQPEKGVYEAGIWFLKNANYYLRRKYPGVMLIAEDSSQFLKVTAPVEYGGLGFDYKWDFGWMHDTLEYLALPPAQRQQERGKFLHSTSYFYQETYLLPFSHDEVVHGKKTVIDKLYGDRQAKFAQARTLYLHMFTHPGKKLNFMGNELAEFREWDENKSLGWNILEYPEHRTFQRYMEGLNHLYRKEPALFREDYNSECFRWLDFGENYPAVFAYLRKDFAGHALLIVLNFSARYLKPYRLAVEGACFEEIWNTDAKEFGGKGYRNREIKAVSVGKGRKELFLELAPYGGCVIRIE